MRCSGKLFASLPKKIAFFVAVMKTENTCDAPVGYQSAFAKLGACAFIRQKTTG